MPSYYKGIKEWGERGESALLIERKIPRNRYFLGNWNSNDPNLFKDVGGDDAKRGAAAAKDREDASEDASYS